MVTWMDLVGLIEVLIIAASLYAIWHYSQPENEKVPASSSEDFAQLMCEHIDKKMGHTVEKTEHGLLDKAYVLQLQKVIVYFSSRASQLSLQQERQTRRQLFEYKKWAKYKQAVLMFQQIRIDRHLEFTVKACQHLGIPEKLLVRCTQMISHKEVRTAQEDGQLAAAVDMQEYTKVPLRRARMAQVDYMARMADLMREAQNMSEEALAVEKAKVEDEVFTKFEVEMEHIIKVQREVNDADQSQVDASQTQDTTQDSNDIGHDFAQQPLELLDWSQDKQYKWFASAFQAILPIQMEKEGLVPFVQLLQIYRILQPVCNPDSISKRRELYKSKAWDSYSDHMAHELTTQVKISRTGHQALNDVCGLQQSDLQRAMMEYSTDFDKRDTIQKVLEKTSAPSADQPAARCLSKRQVLHCVRYLQQRQVESYSEALKDAGSDEARLNEEGTDAAEERFQLRVHIEMAKSRDKLFLEQNVSEADIDLSIQQLDLEQDKEFCEIMKESEAAIESAFKNSSRGKAQ